MLGAASMRGLGRISQVLVKRMKIIFAVRLTKVRCTLIIVSSLRRGARVAKGGRL